MSVFHEIDKLMQHHKDVLADTKARAAELKGRAVRATHLGWWLCSYRPTSGDRKTIRIRARSPEELLSQLATVRGEHRKARAA